MRRAIGGYFVHAYTASGVGCGWLALVAAIDGDARTSLLWLSAATLIDATDGALARLADVGRTAPAIDGARLDDIVDYVTYVLVPGVLVWRLDLLPPPPRLGHRRHARRQRPRLRAPGRQDRRPPLHRLSVLLERRRGLPDRAAAGAAGRGRHPAPARRAGLRADPLRLPVADRDPASADAVARRAVGLAFLALIWQLPDPPAWLVWVASIYPAYYVALSLWLTARRRSA